MNDGGPAFPRPASEYTEHGTLHDGNRAIDDQEGMSLRDWFAGKAIEGCYTDGTSDDFLPAQRMAEAAYRLADAMLLARKERQTLDTGHELPRWMQPCPSCFGRGGWEDPEEGQWVTCVRCNATGIVPIPAERSRP